MIHDGKTEAITEYLDEESKKAFKRKRSTAKATQTCVMCGGSADVFKDELSRREYRISGFCQTCQDKVWRAMEEEA